MKDYIGKLKPVIDEEIFRNLGGEVPGVWDRGKDFLLRGGKRIRPALVLLGMKEAGGREEKILSLAAAVEILHNFTLIHDDIEDNSELRRGKPCMHIETGIPLAINTGDLLFAKAFELAAMYGPFVSKRFAETVCGIAEGQEQDISWSSGDYIPTEEEYMGMILRKTGQLIGFALESGYMVERGETNESFRKYGLAMGAAFQIIDDVLGIAGERGKTGKDVDKDILESKRSLPVIKALEAPGSGEFRERFLKSEKTGEDVEFIRKFVGESGSLDYCRKKAREILEGAGMPFRDKDVKEKLGALSKFILERES